MTARSNWPAGSPDEERTIATPPNQPPHSESPPNQPTPYEPPSTPGASTSGKLSAVVVVALVTAGIALVGSLIAIVVLGVGSRGWLAGDDEPDDPEPRTQRQSEEPAPAGPVALPERLDVRVVTTATPGECPADSGGGDEAADAVTVTDGPEPECLELGGGFFVIELADVTAGPSQHSGDFVVTIEFLPEAAETLGELTSEHVGERMVFTYADEVIMHATVSGPIEGGELQVTANMTRDEAEDLAARIRGD